MNKDFLKTIFHSDVGYVYEYIGSIPEEIEIESTEMCSHITENFIKGHGNSQVSTMVVQLPFYNNKIVLYCNSITDINVSDEFVLLTDLVPDVIVEPVVEETPQEEIPQEEIPQEETPQEETPQEETPIESEGQ